MIEDKTNEHSSESDTLKKNLENKIAILSNRSICQDLTPSEERRLEFKRRSLEITKESERIKTESYRQKQEMKRETERQKRQARRPRQQISDDRIYDIWNQPCPLGRTRNHCYNTPLCERRGQCYREKILNSFRPKGGNPEPFDLESVEIIS